MRHHRIKAFKKHIFFWSALLLLSLAGCGTTKADTAMSGQTEPPQGTQEMEEAWEIQGGMIQEDEQFLYVCGAYQITKIDKETKESEILWENAGLARREGAYLYSYGAGLLTGDMLYFMEIQDDTGWDSAFSVIHTDGTGYEELGKLNNSGVVAMLLKDGILYILPGNNDMIQYPLSGEPNTADTLSVENIRKLIGYDRRFRYNSRYYLMHDDTDKDRLYLVNKETSEKREFMTLDADTDSRFLGMDEEYVYIQETTCTERKTYHYKKISIADGTESSLFELTKNIFDEPQFLMHITIQNGYLYYVGEKDYKLYIMRRELANPGQEELLGEAFYDSGIKEVGTVDSYDKWTYSEINPELLLFSPELYWLQVDGRFPGADKINQFLAQWQEENLAYEEEGVVFLENEVREGRESFIPWSYNSRPSEIFYFDERYLSFCQWESDYRGGVHALPYWIGFTFDLQTGERLRLEDVITNNEEALKDIVNAYFTEKMNAEPGSYWSEAKISCNSMDLDPDFYLTKEGICFWFVPHILAPYPGDFKEVIIPYEKFDLRISLAGAEPITEKKELVLASEDWGLGFGEEGTQPVGNASAADLKEYDAYYMGDDSEKVIYLTFDCGYENGNTEPILDALKKHHAPAAFFVVGHYLESAPDLVKRMVEEGHAVGNHTYHHPDMSSISELADFQKEMDDVASLFYEITGTELAMYYRPPQGKCNVSNLEMAQELGYSTIFWSLAYVDWDTGKQPTHQEAFNKLIPRIHPGAVVLLHNTSRTNGEILDELLTKWEEMGYTFQPLSNLTEPTPEH